MVSLVWKKVWEEQVTCMHLQKSKFKYAVMFLDANDISRLIRSNNINYVMCINFIVWDKNMKSSIDKHLNKKISYLKGLKCYDIR